MLARLQNLIDDLQLRLPGVVLGAIQPELRNTLRDFFRDTNAWREDVTFNIKPNVITYDVLPDSPSTIVRLMQVANADGVLVRYVRMPEIGTIILPNAPSQPETWTATVALTITGDKDKNGYPLFPSWVLDQHYEAIMNGTLARLLSQPAKPYSNPQMALTHQKQYTSEKAQTRHRISVQNLYGGQRWRFPAFA